MRSGKSEALVSVAGNVKSVNRKKIQWGEGTIAGQFTFDPERGYITSVNLAMSPELPEDVVGNFAVSINVDLSRVDGNPNNIELVAVDKAVLDEAETLSLTDVQTLLKTLANVKVENENFISIKTGKDGDKKIFGNVPVWLQDRTFHFDSQKAGVTQFTVESDGIVLMAVSPRYRAGVTAGAPAAGVFSKIRDPWFSECKSKRDLLNEGWQESGVLPILGSAWPLYYRECKKGESYRIRTEKTLAPVIMK